MIRGLYTVRDESSGLYMSIQVNDNNDVAMRSFDFAMQSNEMMRFAPQDFSLWYVGDYDDVTGVIDAKNPICIKRGVKRGSKKG